MVRENSCISRAFLFCFVAFAMVAQYSAFAKKVQVELYYMPQCPGCRQLISNSFNDAFHTEGFHDMAEVSFIPWGKKHRDLSSELHLEHHDRVFDNVLESCALHTIGKDQQELQFAYIDCIDHTQTWTTDPSKVDRSCAKMIGLSEEQTKRIETCAVSQEGHDLAEANLQRSEEIGMEFAPWTRVDGEHSVAIDDAVWESLFDYVCRLYQGNHKSPLCPNEEMMTEQL